MDLFLSVVSFLFLVVFVLVSVAFFTLMERKVLGYIHFRVGPNKVGLVGLLQPFSDAVKLFSKEQSYPLMSNFVIYYFSPVVNLFLSLLLWGSLPFVSFIISFNFSVLFVLSVSSLGVYSVMLAGWSSNSNYSMLGSLRAVAQMISYEVSLILILLLFFMLIFGFNFMDLHKYQSNVWFLFVLYLPSLMIFVSFLAETNRSPFDFAEGESELVSGFNVEYSSGGFAMLFLAEYSSILFMSAFLSMLVMGGKSIFFPVKMILLSFFWVWVRGTFPRYRYDKLMYLVWKVYLLITLGIFMFYYSLSILGLLYFN